MSYYRYWDKTPAMMNRDVMNRFFRTLTRLELGKYSEYVFPGKKAVGVNVVIETPVIK